MFNKEMRLPLDMLLGKKERINEGYTDYVKRTAHELHMLYHHVNDLRENRKEERDEKNRDGPQPHQWKRGEYVWLHIPKVDKGISKKLAHRWYGPYEFITQTSPVNYEIKLVGSTKTSIVHGIRLKAYHDPFLRVADSINEVDANEYEFDDSAEEKKDEADGKVRERRSGEDNKSESSVMLRRSSRNNKGQRNRGEMMVDPLYLDID
jgi:hypothetical protein